MIISFSTFFFVLLVVLLIERFFNCSKLRQWNWLVRYHGMIDRRFAGKASMVIVLIMLLPVALVVGLLEISLRLWLYGILGILFDFFVLLYCLGPRSTWQDLETVKALATTEQEHDTLAFLDVESMSYRSGVWLMLIRRVMAPACWFALLGAGGVFFYRMTEVCARILSKNSETAPFASRAKILLNGFDWLPVRIFGLIFALVGHFALVMSSWKKTVFTSPLQNESVFASLGEAGIGLQGGQSISENNLFINELSKLLERSLIVFMVILAIIVLIL